MTDEREGGSVFHFIIRRMGWVLQAASACAMLAISPVMTHAQDIALVAEAPRFLFAPERGAATVEVNAARVPIFQRRVSLSIENQPLGAALDDIARLAEIHLVYSRDVVDVTRPVRLRAQDITVAGALSEVLLGARVDVVLTRSGEVTLIPKQVQAAGSVSGRVIDSRTGLGIPGARVGLKGPGTDRSVLTNEQGAYRVLGLAPGRYAITVRRIGYSVANQTVTVVQDQDAATDVTLTASAAPLDAVVVTGTIVPTEQKELSNPITIITAKNIEDRGITKINDLFRGDVPGVFSADYGAANLSYGAPVYVRGTAELWDAPTLKTYVDGVEVANSQFVNEIDPTMIDHVEIIRGPEAATLYGSQAISGVMQIFTKKGLLGAAPRVTLSSGIGTMEGTYGTGTRSENNVSATGGLPDLSYNVGATYNHEGAWTPHHFVDTYSGYGGLSIRPTNSPLSVDLTARVSQIHARGAGGEANARAVMEGTLQAGNYAIPNRNVYTLPQQTLGIAVHYSARPNWQHQLTIGTDRGSNGNDAVVYPTFATISDTLSSVFSAQSNRTTAAYNTAIDLPLSDKLSANIVTGADYWDYQSHSFVDYGTPRVNGPLGTQNGVYASQYHDYNSGVFAQARLGVADALFMTAGARLDQGPSLPKDRNHRYLAPRVGASYVRGIGSLRAKLRLEAGTALKPARPSMKQYIEYDPTYRQLAAPDLRPERQTGWDGGIDLYAGDRASLTVTRYRQLARDLIYYVYRDLGNGNATIQFENIALVNNSGWELEGTTVLLPILSLKATYSMVRSVIDSLSPDDQTGFHVHDELPGVPHHTGALSLNVHTARLTLEPAVSYVGTSVNYDQGGAYNRYFPRLGPPSYDLPIKTLPATYRLGMRTSYVVTPRLDVFARGENLTNRIVYDQGFIPIDQLGRTTLVGLRVH